MMLTKRIVYAFCNNNLRKLKIHKLAKSIAASEHNKKVVLPLVDKPVQEQKIPHSWSQYYFMPFVIPVAFMGLSLVTPASTHYTLINMTTASTLIPLTMANILFYKYPFQNKSKSRIFLAANAVLTTGIVGCLYFYPTQPIMALFLSMGSNIITGFVEYFTRNQQFKQSPVDDSQQIITETVDLQSDEYKTIKRYRLQQMLIVFRFFSAALLLMNLTFLAKTDYYKKQQLTLLRLASEPKTQSIQKQKSQEQSKQN